jgi:bla regulator protein BlaR1
MNVMQFFSLPSIQALGWSLVHSLWQGLVCIVVALAVLRCLPSKWSSARYAVATVSLLVIFLSSLTTFIYLNDSFERGPIESTTQGYYEYPVESLQQENNYLTGLLLTVKSTLQQYLPFIVLCWGIGTLLFAIRLFGGWLTVKRLKASAIYVDDNWNERLQNLTRKLGIKEMILLAESAIAQAPVVIGFFKPVILIPIGMFGGLSTEQLESIIIHELIHIRRRDYLVNLLQSMLEAVYFFNPFVWVISGIIRREREHCCDDAVIKVHGNALAYAQALTALEEARLSRIGLALSFADNKKQLLNRIKRIMEKSVQSYSGRERIVPAILLITGLICASWLTIQKKESGRDLGKQSELVKEIPVSADTTIKIEVSGRYYKKTVTTVDKDGNPHEEVTEGYDGDEELQPLIAQMAPAFPVIPQIDVLMATPAIPASPASPQNCSDKFQKMRSDMTMAMQAIHARAPHLIIDNFHLDSIPLPTSPGFDWHLNGNWDEFSREFENSFGDFYEKRGEEFEAMMEQLETKFNDRSMEEFATQMEQHEDVWERNEEAMKNLEQDMQRWEEANHDQLQQLDEQIKAMEERRWKVEKALREQLVKDGYLASDEKIKSIEINDEIIKINDKEIKEADRKKYHDLLEKHSYGPHLDRDRRE